MAIMQNSYLYHSSQDIPSKIEPGAVQHMGENTMALLKHLTSSAADLTHIKPASTTVFFSGLGGLIFIMYSKTKALRVYTSLFVAGMTLITRNVKSKHYSIYFFGFLAAIGSLLGFVIGSNVVAFIMSIVLGKPLSWYRYESFPILLFGPPALAGGLSVQYLFSKLTHKSNRLRSGNDDHVLSHATLSGLIALNGITSVLGAYFNIGAAYLPAIGLVSMLLSLMINDFILAPITGKRGHLHLPMYLAALVSSLVDMLPMVLFLIQLGFYVACFFFFFFFF
jgi:MFS family permease